MNDAGESGEGMDLGDRNANPTIPWMLLTLVAAATGVAGWSIQGAGPLDAVYQTFQLFLLNFPPDAEVNPVLQVGRYTAAAATGIALLLLGGRIVKERLGRRRIARLRGHTVVIGSGRTGTTILKSLRRHEPGTELLAIDISQAALDGVAHLEVNTLRGDGRSSEMLRRRAGIADAHRVIISVKEWGQGTEIAATAAAAAVSAEAVLTHVDDLSLSHALRLRYLTTEQGSSDVFNLHENAAQALLRTYDDRLAGAAQGPTRIVLVGGARLSEALLVHASFSWLASLREFPLQLCVVAEEPERLYVDVARRWPMLADRLAEGERCEMSPMAFAVDGRLSPQDLVIVDVEEPDHGVAAGLSLSGRYTGRDIIVVGRTPAEDRAITGVEVQDLSTLAWNPNILDADSLWQLAHSLHETYRQGVLAGTSPHGVRWEQLPAQIQRDNRKAVAFMLEQLVEHGFSLMRADRELVAMPAAELSAVIDADRLESLAMNEHHRWLADRGAAARYARRWSDLEEKARQATRDTVATWPRLLLRLGYQILSDTIDVDRLLEHAQKYRRVGEEVRAYRVAEPTGWRTEMGQQLHASPGDWILRSGESRWSINDRAFTRTYEHVADDRYRPVGTVQATRLEAPGRVTTLEGELAAHPGQWLVRNELDEVWVIDGDLFQSRYRPI